MKILDSTGWVNGKCCSMAKENLDCILYLSRGHMLNAYTLFVLELKGICFEGVLFFSL